MKVKNLQIKQCKFILLLKLKAYGAIPIIVQHIKSNNDEVRFNACWAVTCCAGDIHIAADFCRYGLDILFFKSGEIF